jgi:hypothetical protein
MDNDPNQLHERAPGQIPTDTAFSYGPSCQKLPDNTATSTSGTRCTSYRESEVGRVLMQITYRKVISQYSLQLLQFRSQPTFGRIPLARRACSSKSISASHYVKAGLKSCSFPMSRLWSSPPGNRCSRHFRMFADQDRTMSLPHGCCPSFCQASQGVEDVVRAGTFKDTAYLCREWVSMYVSIHVSVPALPPGQCLMGCYLLITTVQAMKRRHVSATHYSSARPQPSSANRRPFGSIQ